MTLSGDNRGAAHRLDHVPLPCGVAVSGSASTSGRSNGGQSSPSMTSPCAASGNAAGAARFQSGRPHETATPPRSGSNASAEMDVPRESRTASRGKCLHVAAQHRFPEVTVDDAEPGVAVIEDAIPGRRAPTIAAAFHGGTILDDEGGECRSASAAGVTRRDVKRLIERAVERELNRPSVGRAARARVPTTVIGVNARVRTRPAPRG